MFATWRQAPAAEVLHATRAAWEKGITTFGRRPKRAWLRRLAVVAARIGS
jgi:hypothetical protein